MHQQCISTELIEHFAAISESFATYMYLDNIIIWSNTVEEHHGHTCLILKALEDAGLYCNLKKMKLFQHEVHFLGHIVNQDSILLDDKKVK
jgi:hypothetical protein